MSIDPAGGVARHPARRHLALLKRLDGIGRPAPMMAAWGVLMGVLTLAILLTIAPHPWPIEPSRADGLRDSLAMLGHGGPLLLGRHAGGQLYAVGVTDDQGMFIYIPWLTYVLGISDPLTTLRDAYAVMFAVTVVVSPLVFQRLGRSILAGALAPILLVPCIVSVGFNDVYWIAPWATLTLLPLVFLLVDRRLHWGVTVPVAVVLALLAGWVSSLRSDAGLGVLIALVIVVLLRRWRWWRVIPVLAVLALAYWATSTEVAAVVRAHRDHRIGTTALSRGQPTGHPFWHTAYIGIGYLPNPQGIHYRDGVAIAYVARHAPGARFLSPRYEGTLRRAYVSIAENHTGEFLREYGAKILVTVADAGPWLLLVALVMPWWLRTGSELRRRRLWTLLTLPALVLAFLPPILAIPLQIYEQGLYGTLGLLAILGLIGAVEAFVRGAADAHKGLAITRRLRHTGVRQTLAISFASIVLLAAISAGAWPVRHEALQWQGFSSGVLVGLAPPTAAAAPRA